MAHTPDRSDETAPLPTFRTGRGRRATDSIVRILIRWGLFPRSYTLTTTGRRTGRPLTHPVTLVDRHGRRWLVSPYGQVSWVHNARASGRVSLQRRGRVEECAVREVRSPREAAPVLKAYVATTGPPRHYFRADKDAPVQAFAAEAADHPVFEVLPLGSTALEEGAAERRTTPRVRREGEDGR